MNTHISNDARLGLRSTKFTDLKTWPSYYSGHAAQRPRRSSVAAGWDRSWTSLQPASTKGGLVTSSVPDTRKEKVPKREIRAGAPHNVPLSWGHAGNSGETPQAQRPAERARPRARGAQRARPGLGRLTLQSLRTNIMPWPGYMGPEQK